MWRCWRNKEQQVKLHLQNELNVLPIKILFETEQQLNIILIIITTELAVKTTYFHDHGNTLLAKTWVSDYLLPYLYRLHPTPLIIYLPHPQLHPLSLYE